MSCRAAVRRPPGPAGLALALAVLTGWMTGCAVTGTEGGGATESRATATAASPTTTEVTTTTDGATMTTDGPGGGPGEATAGAVLSADDTGTTVRLAPGEEVSLRLTPPWDGTAPVSDDPAVVEVVPVDHFEDPGYAEFTLLAHAGGQTVVRTSADDGEEVTVTVDVE